jgi:hypothetical protein
LYIQWKVLKIQWKISKAYYKPKRILPKQKKKDSRKILYLGQESRVGWGLVTPNYTILNQRVLRYVGCNTGAWFDEANAAWLARKSFNEGALGEVLRLQGREDFIQLLANLPNVIS